MANKRIWTKSIAAFAISVFSVLPLRSTAAQRSTETSADLEKVLTWLPADTETVIVARGIFVFPTPPESPQAGDSTVSEENLTQYFESLPLGLFQLKHGALSNRLKGRQVALAVEGARHFRPPAGLGEMPFEGCEVAIFSGNSDDSKSMAQQTAKEALKVEQIQGEQVSVFEEKVEEDIWTTFVVFPGNNVILISTDRQYLTQALSRLHGHSGERALGPTLPEWKQINTEDRFWGLRHFDRSQSNLDPTSPFGRQKSANIPDETAIGLTFKFDPRKGRSAAITYFSGDTGLLGEKSLPALAMGNAPEAKGLSPTFRTVTPGVLEGTYALTQTEPVGYFLFVLGSLLGHAVYL